MKNLPDELTIGEAYFPAMNIENQQEADEYFQALVDRDMRCFHKSRSESEKLERVNLGWMAGYYDHKTRERVERLFHCSHPVFGSIAENGIPTTKEAFEIGKKFALK